MGDVVTYRRSPALIVVLAFLAVGGGTYLLLRWSHDATVQELIAVGIAWCAFWGFLLASLARRRTVIDDAGIKFRHMLRTQNSSWSDIAEIRVEPHTPLVGTTDEHQFVVIYDANLRRHALPMLSGPTAAELAEPLDDLRARWKAHRGKAWSSRTAAVEAEVDWRQRRGETWKRAVIAALVSSFLPLSIILVAAVTAGITLLVIGVLMLVALPVTVLLLAATVGLLRARRQRPPLGPPQTSSAPRR